MLYLNWSLHSRYISARDAIVKYAIYGLKKAKQLVGEHEESRAVFDYIQKVEDLRHCEDPVAAAVMVAQHNFTLEHVPGHLLISQDVSYYPYVI